MPTMAPTTHLEVIEAAEHMPGGSRLVVHDFSWDEYERLLEERGKRRKPRLVYDCGRLDVVSTSQLHDRYEFPISRLVSEYCETFDLSIEGFGRSTWKRKDLLKGLEADACFYIQNAARVIGKKEFDVDSDPLPDLAIEIDITSDSRRKFGIYAALGFPEVWCYDGERFYFYELNDGKYGGISSSRSLPGLLPSMLEEALRVSDSRGFKEGLQAFRRLIATLKK
jgi:Uma2 family endonuclease